jgi:hypothetical protein
MGQGQNNGIGNIRYEGNKITVEAEPDSIGDVSITTAVGRVQCFWDGSQWVCNSIGFSTGQSGGGGQTYE